jgi:N-dimethylarginine dimethylaminohydrolase
MEIFVQNETSRLRAVVLGLPNSNGPVPTPAETYDSKSYESVINGTYPKENDIIAEMTALKEIFLKYDVEVYRPNLVENCNQIFSRDVGFVIDDKIVVSNVIPNRENEMDAYKDIYSKIRYRQIFNLPEAAHIEGGDVILHNNYIFVGQYAFPDYPQIKTARTNTLATDYLRILFPHKTIVPLNLRKNDTDPREGILHLDCTFMPVGGNKAIIYKDGFVDPKDADFLVNLFGKENVFELSKEEMYYMNSNIFSIAPDIVVVEERFTRLKAWLEGFGIKVETVPYYEISKMVGLLRCSTLPLRRDK